MEILGNNGIMGWAIIAIVAPLIIGMAGEVAKKLTGAHAGARGWRGVYYVTYRAHALLAGALLGWVMHLTAGPLPAAFGEELGGYLMAYTFSGGVSMVAYDVIIKSIEALVKHLAARWGYE
jgi:hypothetical protein